MTSDERDDPAGGWRTSAPVARRAEPAPATTGRGPRSRRARRTVAIPKGLLLIPLVVSLACAAAAIVLLRSADAPAAPGLGASASATTASLHMAPTRPSTSAPVVPTPSARPSHKPAHRHPPTPRPTRRAVRPTHAAMPVYTPPPAPAPPPVHTPAPHPTPQPTPQPEPHPTHHPAPQQTAPVDPNAPPTPKQTGPVLSGRALTSAFRSTQPRSRPVLRRRLGFRIRHTGRAGGDWIGSYHVGGRIGYLYQPQRRPVGRFRPVLRRTADLAGHRAPSRRRTEMAAWILAAYGSYHSAIQAAGVDAAIDTLLAPSPWHLGGRLGAARLTQSGHAGAIRSMARAMLGAARASAGPVRLTVSAQPAPAGTQAVVDLRLLDTRTGTGLAGYRVRVAGDGGTRTATTDRHGRATLYYSDLPAGTTPLRARVSGIRDWRLTYRTPLNRPGSRAALANRHVTLTTRSRLVGVTQQTVSITSRRTVAAGSDLGGHYRVVGGQGARTIDITAYGPFDTAEAAACTGTPAYTAAARTITADGTYPLPGYAPRRSGFYVWSVAVEANPSSTATSACGSPEAARAAAGLAQVRASVPRTARFGQALTPRVRVTGFDRAEPHTLRTRLFGPYPSAAKATCGATRQVRTVSASVDGNGSVTLPPLHVQASDGAGYYAFSSVLDSGPLVSGASTACAMVVHVTG